MLEKGDKVEVFINGLSNGIVEVVNIEADIKLGWWKVSLDSGIDDRVVWILREPQMDGEKFTMGGVLVQLRKLEKETIPKKAIVYNFADEKKKRR